jgi:hypothetical protein
MGKRETIETIINTTAIALTTLGVQQLTNLHYAGYSNIMFGMLLEFFKYKGRQMKIW